MNLNINNQKKKKVDSIRATVLYALIPISCVFGISSLSKSFNEEIIFSFQREMMKNEIPYYDDKVIAKDIGIPENNDVLFSYLKRPLISADDIIGMEIPMMWNSSSLSYDDHRIGIDENNDGNVSKINPFSVTSDSIVKLNPEEINGTDGLKVSKAFDPSLVKALNEGNPEVLIYHSHTMESYGVNNSTDYSKSVIGVGTVLQEELKKYGISSIHDIRINRSYNESYQLSREVVQKYLKKYDTFKIVVDIHRDSVPNKSQVTTTLNGESVAKISFVTANNNPHAKDNKALINSINDNARSLFPGLSRGIICYNSGKNNAFNQDLSKNSFLLEVGSQVNTPKEAQTTAKYVARLIAEQINKK